MLAVSVIAGGRAMEHRINMMERSLLHDLVALYRSDLEVERHSAALDGCLACAKQGIIKAIEHYEMLDSLCRGKNRQGERIGLESQERSM